MSGGTEKLLKITKPTYLIFIQSWGDGTSKIRGHGPIVAERILEQGAAVYVTEDVVVVVPDGVTIDFLYIIDSQ